MKAMGSSCYSYIAFVLVLIPKYLIWKEADHCSATHPKLVEKARSNDKHDCSCFMLRNIS